MSLLGLMSFAAVAWAAGPVAQADLVRLDARVGDLEGVVQAISEDLTTRRGLMGNREAKERYEDAVYAYLVADYERAAREFFTLVESGSLRDPSLAADASWYLAECLFEMGNLVLAEEVYDALIKAGPQHPFFADAVRRQLELFSTIGDAHAFYSLYNTWILTGRVEATDSIKYTLAKSFYLQGDHARAKSLFTEIEPVSGHYARARYFYGTVLVGEGTYEEAIEEFRKSSEVSIRSAEDRAVVDLAHLALGRLYYETGDFSASSTYYQRIGKDSAHFDDALYEVVWTFIKQEDYQSALEAVEIFLLAYPEHAYTAQLKLVQGHLHRKLQEYEAALNRYEAIVEEYTPIAETIDQLAEDNGGVDWFERLEQMDSGTFESGAVPRYAVELLVSKDEVGRSRGIYRDLEQQLLDIEESVALVAEIEDALELGAETLGSFQQDRRELRRAEYDAMRLKEDLLEVEEAFLLANLPAELRPEVRGLQQRRDDLEAGMSRRQDAASSMTDALQIYEEQVRAVQQRAFRLEQVIRDLQAQTHGVIEFVESGQATLSPVEAIQVQQQARDLLDQLDQLGRKAQQIQSDATRRAVMFPLEQQAARGTADAEDDLVGEFEALRRGYGAYRHRIETTDRLDVLSQLDGMWTRVDSVDGLIAHAGMAMNQLERKELSTVKKRLKEEAEEVTALSHDVSEAIDAARVLASDITRAGFTWLAGVFGDNVMGADVGIVDVYWVRKSAVSTERDEVIAERQELLEELQQNFDRIRQGLE